MPFFKSSRPDPALEFFPVGTALKRFKIKVYPYSRRLGVYPDNDLANLSKPYSWVTQISHTDSWLELLSKDGELGKVSTSGDDASEIVITLGRDIPSPRDDIAVREYRLRRTEVRGGHEWRLSLPSEGANPRGLVWSVPSSASGQWKAYLAIDTSDNIPLALELWRSRSWLRHRHPQLFLRADLGLGMETLVLLATVGASDLAGIHKFAVHEERERVIKKQREIEQRRKAGGGGSGGGGGGSGGMDGGGGNGGGGNGGGGGGNGG